MLITMKTLEKHSSEPQEQQQGRMWQARTNQHKTLRQCGHTSEMGEGLHTLSMGQGMEHQIPRLLLSFFQKASDL